MSVIIADSIERQKTREMCLAVIQAGYDGLANKYGDDKVTMRRARSVRERLERLGLQQGFTTGEMGFRGQVARQQF